MAELSIYSLSILVGGLGATLLTYVCCTKKLNRRIESESDRVLSFVQERTKKLSKRLKQIESTLGDISLHETKSKKKHASEEDIDADDHDEEDETQEEVVEK